MLNNETNGGKHNHTVTIASLLITLGIIYGDIGTSPLYVFKSIIGKSIITPELVLGGLSCVVWTLTIQTTFKYVLLTLNADNKGEGGIFSLYALVKRLKVKWLIFPAIIGGSTLLADGIITPSISVSSAVEGLKSIPQFANINTIPIVIAVIIVLFIIQQFGTKKVGKSFGPIMLIWFSMLSILGISQLLNDVSILKAIYPYYAINLLVNEPQGFWVLGAVFLCTTGAEALYSDLGHCGKENIRIGWIFVKISLLLNYFGQGAWLLSKQGTTLNGANPFYEIVPDWFLLPSIVVATFATIVASQALISGSFTLINEAIRLNFWPKVKIDYPTELKGQLYIPFMNWFLLVGCIGIVLFFQSSEHMEAAYGLAIVMAMLMTTSLLSYYMILKRYNKLLVFATIAFFLLIEISFLISNMSKFTHGGWVTLLLSAILVVIMWSWYNARNIKSRYVEYIKFTQHVETIVNLSRDESVPKYATHLVFLTSANAPDEIEQKILYSITQKQPKRADIYWFLHVDVVDEPYTTEYKVTNFAENIIRIDFKLGFRVAPRINLLFRKVVEDMVRKNEVNILSRYKSLKGKVGDFKFVMIQKQLSPDNDFPLYEKIMINIYNWLKNISQPEEKAFGLDTSSVTIETFPLVIMPVTGISLTRIEKNED
jgi:KUP system potassium uptake protein